MGRLLDHEVGLPNHETAVAAWYAFLRELKIAQGNASNDLAFVTGLMAKEYLASRHDIEEFDVSAKPQGAPGLDIDVLTLDGARIVAEIKATIPYRGSSLGANQEKRFKEDFAKLQKVDAEFRYFFVTEDASFRLAAHRYGAYLRGVTLVLLPDERETTLGEIS